MDKAVKQKLTQLLCICLSILMMLNSPISSLADTTLGGNTNSGGGTNIGVDAGCTKEDDKPLETQPSVQAIQPTESIELETEPESETAPSISIEKLYQ